MEERYGQLRKQQLNIILLVDVSKSMQGIRINEVNEAIKDIKDYLIDLESENINIDFYISIIKFGTDISYHTNGKMDKIDDFIFTPIKAKGWSNLHLAYRELNEILKKESKGGLMPDFGGIAPAILLLTDGHPTESTKEELNELKKKPWFNVAIRYGVAIELNDSRTLEELNSFVGNNGSVINCIDSNVLSKIIKIIVMTASKVKSSSSKCSVNPKTSVSQISISTNNIKQEIKESIEDIDSWEW